MKAQNTLQSTTEGVTKCSVGFAQRGDVGWKRCEHKDNNKVGKRLTKKPGGKGAGLMSKDASKKWENSRRKDEEENPHLKRVENCEKNKFGLSTKKKGVRMRRTEREEVVHFFIFFIATYFTKKIRGSALGKQERKTKA